MPRAVARPSSSSSSNSEGEDDASASTLSSYAVSSSVCDVDNLSFEQSYLNEISSLSGGGMSSVDGGGGYGSWEQVRRCTNAPVGGILEDVFRSPPDIGASAATRRPPANRRVVHRPPPDAIGPHQQASESDDDGVDEDYGSVTSNRSGGSRDGSHMDDDSFSSAEDIVDDLSINHLPELIDVNGNPDLRSEMDMDMEMVPNQYAVHFHEGGEEEKMEVDEDVHTTTTTKEPILISIDSLRHGIFPSRCTAADAVGLVEEEEEGEERTEGEHKVDPNLTLDVLVLRLSHSDVSIREIILHPESVEVHFTTSNPTDSRFARYLVQEGEKKEKERTELPTVPPDQVFIWHCLLGEEYRPILTDRLHIRDNNKEFVMRKGTELASSRDVSGGLPGRLSSSTSSIRARDYSRSYGDSRSSYIGSSYRYTPSSSSSMSSSTYGTSSSNYGSSSNTYGTSSSSTAASSSSSSTLPRTPISYHRALFTVQTQRETAGSESGGGGVGGRSSGVERNIPVGRTTSYGNRLSSTSSTLSTSPSSTPYSPMKYSASSYATSTLGRDRSRDVASSSADLSSGSGLRSSVRSRSSSVISSFRSPNVNELNRQAAEREKKDREREEYKAWEEREREKEAMFPSEPLVKDFRRKGTSATPTTMSMTSSGGIAINNAASPQATSHSLSSSSSTSRFASSPIPSSSTIESPYSIKPTAKVTPYEERGTVVQPGFTGLRNIGNTCFMNATLQMLVNCIELKTYFLDGHHKADVNSHNPLGFKGRLAEAFAEFMHQMWSCTSRAIEPARIKELVAEKASQFANFAQHDAHEFLSFLLDGLHEDVNRVKTKAITGTVEADGRPDIEVANEAWHNHLLRNDSIFVDLFHGQLKSRLQCPKCDRVSITFDPFLYLPVPFPKQKKSLTMFFWPLDPFLKPVKVLVHYSAEGTVGDVLQALGDIVNAPSKTLRLVEIVSHRIHRSYTPDEKASQLTAGDMLYVFQMHSATDCNEEVIELQASQRLAYSPNLRYVCANCGHNKGLAACQDCYNAYYCNEECQQNHWTAGHREDCRRRTPDLIGQPFLFSLPKSKCTYGQLMRVIEARSKHSVEVFQPPMINGSSSTALPYADEDAPSVKPTRNGRTSSKSPSPPTQTNGISNGAPPPVPSKPSFVGQETVKGGEREKTPKRQAVLPEQRTNSSTRASRTDSRMFHLRRVVGQSLFQGENIEDDGTDSPLPLSSGAVIAVNWRNVSEGKPYVTVDTRKQLDLDEDRGRRLAASSSSSGGGQPGSDPTLQEMLSMFSETERLKPEESWYCSKCKDHVEATKRLELYRLPPVLIIQLKRFVYTASLHTMHRRSKDERRVVYPLNELDLSSFLSDGAPTNLPPVYDLTGVVCHSGSSYFGHYVSMGRLPGFDATKTEIDWRNFDDSIVTKINQSQVQSDDAYLLFYKQRGFATRSTFTRHYSFDPAATATPTPAENGN